MSASHWPRRVFRLLRFVTAAAAGVVFAATSAPQVYAEQPPRPCHPNPSAAADQSTVENRGDVVNLPGPLKDRLGQLANRPQVCFPCKCMRRRTMRANCFSTTSRHFRFRTQCFHYQVSRRQ